MQLTPEQTISIAKKEVFSKKLRFTFGFAIISLLFLALGSIWPKMYSSQSTILIDQQNILQPLMEGTAVTTGIVDQAKIASEIIFSRKVMEQIIQVGQWNRDVSTPLAMERLIEEIKARTKISSIGKGLILISYKDKDPLLAFKVTNRYVELFIEESVVAKRQESQSAFDFIDQQVSSYQYKLKEAEVKLQDFRASNIDARPGFETIVNQRIGELQSRIEQTRLQISEAEIKSWTIKGQLSGEAEVTKSLTREAQYQDRLTSLELQLDTLRLNYHDTYPDIVRLINQIEDLKVLISKERTSRPETVGLSQPRFATNTDINDIGTPILQDLRKELVETTTNIATLKARLKETKNLLVEEEKRVLKIDDVKAKLAELTRDYEVNQEIYQNLLRQREKARVSMNIDLANQGLTLKIQEPAQLPLRPTGLRLMHFALAGLFLGITIPLAFIFTRVYLDGKIRIEPSITSNFDLPLLTTIPHYLTPEEAQTRRFINTLIPLVLATVIGIYLFVAWIKLVKVS